MDVNRIQATLIRSQLTLLRPPVTMTHHCTPPVLGYQTLQHTRDEETPGVQEINSFQKEKETIGNELTSSIRMRYIHVLLLIIYK
jgi:hypothetical protein